MLDSQTVDQIKHITNTEVIRRLLIRYFIDKGYSNNFDSRLYPSVVQDIPLVIAALANKIEIVPTATDIDPSGGKAVLSWNLFVLGNNRMFLGNTYHNNLQDLARQIRSGSIMMPARGMATARKQTTPRQVIAFVTRVLGDHEAGYVDLNPSSRPPRPTGEPYAMRSTLLGMPQQFMNRNMGGY